MAALQPTAFCTKQQFQDSVYALGKFPHLSVVAAKICWSKSNQLIISPKELGGRNITRLPEYLEKCYEKELSSQVDLSALSIEISTQSGYKYFADGNLSNTTSVDFSLQQYLAEHRAPDGVEYDGDQCYSCLGGTRAASHFVAAKIEWKVNEEVRSTELCQKTDELRLVLQLAPKINAVYQRLKESNELAQASCRIEILVNATTNLFLVIQRDFSRDRGFRSEETTFSRESSEFYAEFQRFVPARNQRTCVIL